MRIHRGALVYDRADPRHVGIVQSIAWRTYPVTGRVSVRWLETGWISHVEVAELRLAPDAPSTAEERRGRFEFPRRG